ncbi:hypothetical protein, partial [Bergeriella denitrificans]|uniref:hypothetical protein n=1 Tax=Bergeriella denitrificans TaxID=494 RepID=UPI001C3FE80E
DSTARRANAVAGFKFYDYSPSLRTSRLELHLTHLCKTATKNGERQPNPAPPIVNAYNIFKNNLTYYNRLRKVSNDM